jgi:hypothetical protein
MEFQKQGHQQCISQAVTARRQNIGQITELAEARTLSLYCTPLCLCNSWGEEKKRGRGKGRTRLILSGNVNEHYHGRGKHGSIGVRQNQVAWCRGLGLSIGGSAASR